MWDQWAVGNLMSTSNCPPGFGDSDRYRCSRGWVTNLLGPPGAFLALREGPVWHEQQVLHYSEEYSLHISQPEGERQRSEAGAFSLFLRTTQLYCAFCPNSVHKCPIPHKPSQGLRVKRTCLVGWSSTYTGIPATLSPSGWEEQSTPSEHRKPLGIARLREVWTAVGINLWVLLNLRDRLTKSKQT